jgi:hypothetical protein
MTALGIWGDVRLARPAWPSSGGMPARDDPAGRAAAGTSWGVWVFRSLVQGGGGAGGERQGWG